MFKNYYEVHITFESPIGIYLNIEGWKFSRIENDPVLGPGVKTYLTKQTKASVDLDNIITELNQQANELEKMGYTLLRKKIELVVYDSKTNVPKD